MRRDKEEMPIEEAMSGRGETEPPGKILRRLRKSADLTQSDLAEFLGLSYQQIQKYEYGTSEMTITRLRQISDVLGVSPVVLLGTDNSKTRSLQFLQCNHDENELKALSMLRRINDKKALALALSILQILSIQK
ncbi:MAG: helix-turn-helix transcriptional regulator [Thermodesulfovibrionales bacterium]|nr:helix-turn-helix transcriptional regulator [Thermodesulfovibrionales bacterium]